MTAWPDTLPASPLLDGFRESAPDTILRTDMEQGPAKIRQRTTAAVRTLTLRFLMSTAQVATLETFYLTTLHGGTAPFDFTHPRTGDTVSCRFTAPPQYAVTNGNFFKISFTLEILP